MSYDISLVDPITRKVICADSNHHIRGGTYALGGTDKLWLNITWNYGPHFRRVLGEEGIRSICGTTGAESLPILRAAAGKLAAGMDHDYWAPTEGNARAAIEGLIALAEIAPHGIWECD